MNYHTLFGTHPFSLFEIHQWATDVFSIVISTDGTVTAESHINGPTMICYYNPNQEKIVQAFSIAHEIGHYLYGDLYLNKESETPADIFACIMLTPSLKDMHNLKEQWSPTTVAAHDVIKKIKATRLATGYRSNASATTTYINSR